MTPRMTLPISMFLLGVSLICAGEPVTMNHLSAGRISWRTHPVISEEALMTTNTSNGIVSIRSNHTVDETLEKLKSILQAKGVAIFAIIDHSGDAEKVGLKMPPTKLIIFGSPKAGTPLMLAAPSVAIDLPLKILISEDAEGNTKVSFNSPAYLQQRHGLPQELLQNIAVAEALAAKAAE
jgi:uncharacterized protein (DUF302 family)